MVSLSILRCIAASYIYLLEVNIGFSSIN
uniref:Uncharacterized protein n=1 Tax=Rhizophora mucronata TaxID=61149 RepID=A0A2P2R5A6_RHIMU